jgi:integrase
MSRRWDELRQRAALDWLRLYDLRHGHAEIGVTMNSYTHVLPVLRQEAADAMDELFGA